MTLQEQLCEKMRVEQSAYCLWLTAQPPEEILHHAYEYSVREDIILATEEMNLTLAQVRALLKSPAPLADVYKDFSKLETDYMSIVAQCVEDRADDLLKKEQQQNPPKVYRQSVTYAREHGELQQYHASCHLNERCRDEIDAALAQRFDGLRLGAGAVEQVVTEYGLERTKYVLAAAIQTRDGDKHNLNIIVIGGSGSGKTRFYVKPNALQLIGSYLFLDPKGELTRTLGRIMETKGISVTVLDLVHFQGHYNPMAYLETDEDAIKLAFAIVNNTKPKDAPSGGDKFWDDSSVLLISALILYLMYEAPASEQNFSTLMYMILNCQVSENEMVENPLMMLFGELERRDPQHPAVLQFKSFMLGAKKTLQSILISAAANLYMFNSRKFAEMTSRDEMFLPRMGLEQRALFIVLPDNDTTFNFIATMLYTQLFDQLFRLADSTPEYNGALPVHVRLMMDEFANVALPKNFKNILAVCRSRNISCDIILQNIAQLKSLFKDDWEGIIGNCDTLLYLGGNEYGTYEYLSKILGKETERTKSQSIGKGSRGSSSDSLQTAGRELCMPDEIRRMRDDECLLLMRSEDPVIDRKYNLLKHPNVKYTPDAGGEPYVIPPDYMGDAATITMDAVAAATAPEITEEMYEQLDYLEKHPEENYYENEENFSQYDQGD